MPTIYEKADEDVCKLVEKVMRQYHGELVEVNTQVGVLMAANEDDAPVKLHGYACQAVVKIRNLKDRTMGLPDADIVIDAENWARLSTPEKSALIDHEIHHLELQKDKYNKPKTDDLGRPKLRTKLHDHEFGWFDTIAHRHGDASSEIKQAKAFADQHGQTYFGWNSPPDRHVESLPAKTPDIGKIDEGIAESKRRKAAVA